MNKVVGISINPGGTVVTLLLDCGHTTEVDADDEDSLSFMGAETNCEDESHE